MCFILTPPDFIRATVCSSLQRVLGAENHRALAGHHTAVAVIVGGRSRGPGRKSGDATPQTIERTASEGVVGAKDDGALAGHHTAIAVRQGHIATLDLAFAALAAHLADSLDHHQQAVHAGVAV